jgi:hypothetical protein
LLLDELARNDVLHVDQDGYRFSSSALREALLGAMTDQRLEENHHRLGKALARLAGPDDPELSIQAGWHLIHGGDELEGADLIAEVTHQIVSVQKLIANLHFAGEPIEAALLVYKRYRRSIYARVPLSPRSRSRGTTRIGAGQTATGTKRSTSAKTSAASARRGTWVASSGDGSAWLWASSWRWCASGSRRRATGSTRSPRCFASSSPP